MGVSAFARHRPTPRICMLIVMACAVLLCAPSGAYAVGDVTPPSPPDLSPISHTVSSWSALTQIVVGLSNAADAESGIAGYSWKWSIAGVDSDVDATIDGDHTITTVTSPVTATTTGLYLHLVAINGDGMLSSVVHAGPFLIDTDPPDIPSGVLDGSSGADTDALGTTVAASMRFTPGGDQLAGVTLSGVDHHDACLTTTSDGSDCSTSAMRTWIATTNNNHTFTGLSLAEGTTYYTCVRTIDVAGNASAIGCSDGAIVDVTTSPPTACTAHAQSRGDDSRIILQWTAAANTTGMVGYSIRYRRVGKSLWSTRRTALVVEYLLTNLKAGASYDWEISSLEASGLTSSVCSGRTSINLYSRLTGTSAGDTIVGYSGRDIIKGSAGDDYLYGNAGDDRIFGGMGRDVLQGADGNDLLDGGADNDNLSGLKGRDHLIGGPGNDQMNGGSGNDRLEGGSGDDYINIRDGRGGDTAACGSGADRVVRDPGDHVAADCEMLVT